MITQIAHSLYEQLVADFEVQSTLWQSSETPELWALRQKAFEQFKVMGLPSTKVEDWKYTNLTPFLKKEFATLQDDENSWSVNKETVEQAQINDLDAYRIVLVNGQYQPALSDKVEEEGLVIEALSAAIHRPAFAKHFGHYIDLAKNHFATLNTALFRDGLFIEVKNKAIISKPVHLIHISVAANPVFLQPRHLVVVGNQADVNIVESYLNIGSQADLFINSVAELYVGNNARLQHYNIQTGQENARYIQHTEVYQEGSSIYSNYKASLPGCALLRNNLNVVLDGENTESHLYGLYLAGGKQLVDNHTLVDHRKPHCQSNELYKGVMKDEAVGVFNGKVFVRKPAQKTNAFQQNNNLMLSKKAVIDSKPQLEIFADDVKCSHGSTVGQFNQEALFYLRSRGIGEESARGLLIHAFAFDVTDKIPHEAIQAHVNHLIEEGLK